MEDLTRADRWARIWSERDQIAWLKGRIKASKDRSRDLSDAISALAWRDDAEGANDYVDLHSLEPAWKTPEEISDREPARSPDQQAAREGSSERLAQEEEQRERLSARQLRALANASERERISRELHDRVAHGMGMVHQSPELFSALADRDPERAQEFLALAKENTRRAIDETRDLSAELKRQQEEDLAEGPRAAFVKLASSYVPDGIRVESSISDDESRVPGFVLTQVYLTMREAVTNAVKHSGCSRIGVRLEVSGTELLGLVQDNGKGFDPGSGAKAAPLSRGVGLRSMRERAKVVGGSLSVELEPGAGTRVEVRVPLSRGCAPRESKRPL